MDKYRGLLVFIFIFAFISTLETSSAEYVPVYAWKATPFPQWTPALQTLSQDSFKDIIKQCCSKNTPILVFAEQNLSPEDFGLRDAQGETLFHHLSLVKKSAQIGYWSSVKTPIKAVKELSDQVIETSVNLILEDPTLILEDNNVLIINLNDAVEDEDRLQMLERHDRIMAELYHRFSKKNENIVTLFTGHHSSWEISEEARSHRTIRDASAPAPKAEGNATGITYSTNDILIYGSTVPTLSYKGTSIILDNFKATTSSRTQEYMNVTLNSDVNRDVTITFDFIFGGGYWTLSDVKVHNENADPKDYSLWVQEVYAPEGFSYHCGSQSFSDMKDSTVNFTLPGFQLQVYFTNTTQPNHVFGDAYDCVGFTSVPIWSGLFVTFILVIIMTFGLTMMMDIKTMDRFDDPKGKTITISVTE